MGAHHFQSLLVHLDMFGLYPLERYTYFQRDLSAGPFSRWTDMPTVVCLTLVVPHSAVSMFDDIMKGFGTPLCQLQVHSSFAHAVSYYTDIQLGFGSIKSSGTPFTADYSITVNDDPKGWQGNAPLIVSAMVSTGSLIDDGDPACCVKFGWKSTPANLATCGKKLGMMMCLHESAVGRKDVYITKYRPNMVAHASMPCTIPSRDTGKLFNFSAQNLHVLNKSVEEDVAVTIQPGFHIKTARAAVVKARYDIKSLIVQKALQSAVTVECTLLNPFTLVLKIGDAFHHTLKLPLPLDGSRSKVRIARKSLWVEYQAPVADPALLSSRPDLVFPVMRDMQYVVSTYSSSL
jgi:hypothetical protein